MNPLLTKQEVKNNPMTQKMILIPREVSKGELPKVKQTYWTDNGALDYYPDTDSWRFGYTDHPQSAPNIWYDEIPLSTLTEKPLRELLEEIDQLLTRLEDYTHGEDGKQITILRGKILSLINREP